MRPKKFIVLSSLVIMVCIIFLMHLNNIKLYNTDYGFDGWGHKQYIIYVSTHRNVPLPHEGWEFNQPPLYYILASALGAVKVPTQVINLVLVYLIAFFVYHFTKSKIALLSILSLPMINYFPPQITNELLGSFFIIVCLLQLLNKTNPVVLGILLALGFYSKYTIITLIPLVPLSFFFYEQKHINAVKKSLILLVLFCVLISPILIRNFTRYGKFLPLASDFFAFESPKQSTDPGFFLNLSWIKKQDTFLANNYSFAGGLWNSFWLDSYHVITPVVSYHKKALLLWFLGFPLTAISVFGLIKLTTRDKKKGIILLSYILIALFSLVKYYLDLPYNFVLKAFYAFGLVVPYALSLAEASRNKQIAMVTVSLLLLQLFVMVSFFWIQPWWNVAN